MRLIDADALPVCKEHYIDECGSGANFYVVHKTDIDAAPTITIEAEPVKHGKPNPHIVQWIGDDDEVILEDQVGWECPFCGEDGVKNYCPNCGCKMDLEET